MTNAVELNENHLDQVVALWEACGLTRPWNPAEDDYLRAIAGPASAVLGIIEADQVVATAMVGHDGHRAWVYYVAVDPRRRREGLGRRLMRDCEHWAIEHGIPKLQLMVRDDNTDAVAFYASLGYEVQPVQVLGRRLPAQDKR